MSWWKPLYTQVYYLGQTHSKPNWHRVSFPRYEGFCIMVYRAEWYQNKHTIKYPYSTNIKKCKILVIKSCIVYKRTRYHTNGTSWNRRINYKHAPKSYWTWKILYARQATPNQNTNWFKEDNSVTCHSNATMHKAYCSHVLIALHFYVKPPISSWLKEDKGNSSKSLWISFMLVAIDWMECKQPALIASIKTTFQKKIQILWPIPVVRHSWLMYWYS